MEFTGLDKVQKQLAKLSGPEAKAAYAKAINDTAFEVRRKMQAEMSAVFDRPTPYILRSVQFKSATPDLLETNVQPTYYGGKGVDPQKILATEAEGGSRKDKRSEAALRRVGILPGGYQTAIPSDPYPGSADAFGNLKGGFLVQLIAYFQAFGEQGFKANATEKTIKKLQNKQGIGSIAAKKVYQTTLGVRYFVSYGKLRGNRSSHLEPGIWASKGTHGADVRPVLLFVKAGRYKVRLDLKSVAQKAGGTDYLATRLRYRIRQAAGE